MVKKLFSAVIAVVMVFSCSIASFADTGSNEGSTYAWTETSEDWSMDAEWNAMTDEQRKSASVEAKARACGLTVSDFELIAAVAYSESDDDIEGYTMVAAVILNRVACQRFTPTVSSVVYRHGQFVSVMNGCLDTYIYSTENSQWGVVLACRRLAEGYYPRDMVYFNSEGYQSYRIDVAEAGGNYFSVDVCNCEYCSGDDFIWG